MLSLIRLLPTCLLALGLTGTAAAATAPVKLTILSYHEIAEKADALVPGYAVPPGE